MRHTRFFSQVGRLGLLSLVLAGTAYAGPPFITDDPEPVELHHWEVYLASQPFHNADGWSGTLPHLEVNYGLAPDLQVHVIAPLAFDKPRGESMHYGYGDTELGFKYRFIQETPDCPMVGIFPLLELPTGDADRGLGNGKTQGFLPVWLQKSFGPWSTYGGGGYWFHPGTDNRDYWYTGWQVQRKITEEFALGMEVFHETPKTLNGGSDTVVQLGAIYDFSENYHLMGSVGHTVQGASAFLGYLAFQITFGPDEKDKGKSEKQK